MIDAAKLTENIRDAEVLLIGLGNEIQIPIGRDNAWSERCRIFHCLSEDKEEIKKYIKLYQDLEKIVQNKNYFIVTTNIDAAPYFFSFDKERLAAPCGDMRRMQCMSLEHDIFWVEKEMRKAWKERDFEKLPTCPICGKPGLPNEIQTKPYNEIGYLSDWEHYKKWLQTTINKKLTILELGEGFEYPTVIRWPFEKIAYINQKATLIRINQRLPQISEQVGERGISVQAEVFEVIHAISALLN